MIHAQSVTIEGKLMTISNLFLATKRKFIKYLANVATVLLLTGCNDSDSPLFGDPVNEGSNGELVSVLLVGNSLMNGVRLRLTSLLASSGYIADIGVSNPGGYWLYQHDDYAPTLDLIAQG